MTTARLAVLGSTGSIGTQTLALAAAHPDRFEVVGLAAHGSRPDLLAQQAVRHRVRHVAVADPAAAGAVEAALSRAAREHRLQPPPLDAGAGAVLALAGSLGDGDIVLNAMSGSIGLRPTLAALASGARLALANKESLVVGGELVTAAAAPGQLLPVDSEHTAIAQLLTGTPRGHVARLLVTASGGPFRGRTRPELEQVTPEQALAHPTWRMGRVITTNSATLVNKALEVVEATHLFGVPIDDVDVVVQPQSFVHAMVQMRDGSLAAQASPPDMRQAVAWALAYPDLLADVIRPFDWTRPMTWVFEPLDEDTFPAIRTMRAALGSHPAHPAVLNAANEEAVDAFHDGLIGFGHLLDLPGRVLARSDVPRPDALDVDALLGVESWARAAARDMIAAPAPTG